MTRPKAQKTGLNAAMTWLRFLSISAHRGCYSNHALSGLAYDAVHLLSASGLNRAPGRASVAEWRVRFVGRGSEGLCAYYPIHRPVAPRVVEFGRQTQSNFDPLLPIAPQQLPRYD
jgi:hypothetical protein